MIPRRMSSRTIYLLDSSGNRYDVTLEDEISGSVVVYWDVVLLFMRTSEMIRDYIFRERNWFLYHNIEYLTKMFLQKRNLNYEEESQK